MYKTKVFPISSSITEITTNVRLYQWKMIEHNRCYFCNQEPETFRHLMFECTVVKKFWKAIARWLKYMYSIDIEISYYLIVLNNYTGQHDLFINTAILIAKHYIYATKCTNSKINFQVWLNKLTNMYYDEKFIATKNNVLAKHNAKWKIFLKNM